jgi:hypothetical protein
MATTTVLKEHWVVESCKPKRNSKTKQIELTWYPIGDDHLTLAEAENYRDRKLVPDRQYPKGTQFRIAHYQTTRTYCVYRVIKGVYPVSS